LVPGTGLYSESEGTTTGWDKTSALCDHGSPGDVTVLAGQTTTCTFTNTQRAQIIVKKVTDPTGSTQSFGFTPTGYGSAFSLKDGESNTSDYLAPGSGYGVSEDTPLPTGWTLKSQTCDNGNSPSAITLHPGDVVTCTFTNTQPGRIGSKKV